jgi:acetyl esterase/lipase
VGDHNVKDPLISPIYGDFHGFPPVILTTGTRDMLLSDTVRVHRKLRARWKQLWDELKPILGSEHQLTGALARASGSLDMASLLEALGKTAESRGTTFVIALDEAQEFKRLAGLRLSALMAHVYDYVKGIQWIVTGSQVGVLSEVVN